MKRKIFFAVCFFLVCALSFAGGKKESTEKSLQPANIPSLDLGLTKPKDQEGFDHLLSLHEAFPKRVSVPQFLDGDWTVLLDNERFYWAHGRVLLEKDRKNWKKYAPFDVYDYPEVEIRAFSHEEAKAIAEHFDTPLDDTKTLPRCTRFFEKLYGINSSKSAKKTMQTVSFMGFWVEVHPMVVPSLKALEAGLQDLAKVDPEVKKFFKSLYRIDGSNFRYVAGTKQLSLHSFGIALDLLVNSYKGKAHYWYYVKEKPWYTIPKEERWLIPSQIVDLFERYDFVWGGRWFKYDSMHIEYRPEVFKYSNKLHAK